MKIKEEQKRLKEEKMEQIVNEIVSAQRQRLEGKLIQHLIERIRKEERRRLKLA
jgi:hypothetical protein